MGSASAVIHGWWGLAWALWCASLPLWAVLAYTHPHRRRDRHATSPASAPASTAPGSCSPSSTESIAVLGAPAARPHRQRHARVPVPGRVHPRPRAVPHRDDDGVPALDVPAARAHRSRPAGVDRRRRRRHHRPRRLQPAPRPHGVATDRTACPVRRGRRGAGMGHRHVLVPADGRHRRVAPHRPPVPLRYHPSYWAMVFPLGMYGAATYRMRAPPSSTRWGGSPSSCSPSPSPHGPPPLVACSTSS